MDSENGAKGLESLFKRYDSLIFFDTETTGFDGKENQIIELAAIRIDRGGGYREADEFVKLPEGERVPEKIVELTHITDSMLAEQGKAEIEVAEIFSGFMDGEKPLLIAHNAQFDLNFAAWLFVKYRKQHPEWLARFNAADYLDTLTVYKDRAKYPHKLADAIQLYGLSDKVQNTHRAIDDVAALLEITRAMCAQRDDLLSYVNVFGFNKKYGISGNTLKKITYHAQGFRNSIAPPEQTLPALAK
ncbi:MAG: 3'-5' exonuclease [bacterium]|nr:3'-5' exonuclease [bacterium]